MRDIDLTRLVDDYPSFVGLELLHVLMEEARDCNAACDASSHVRHRDDPTALAICLDELLEEFGEVRLARPAGSCKNGTAIFEDVLRELSQEIRVVSVSELGELGIQITRPRLGRGRLPFVRFQALGITRELVLGSFLYWNTGVPSQYL